MKIYNLDQVKLIKSSIKLRIGSVFEIMRLLLNQDEVLPIDILGRMKFDSKFGIRPVSIENKSVFFRPFSLFWVRVFTHPS